jgi:hypothetical protein
MKILLISAILAGVLYPTAIAFWKWSKEPSGIIPGLNGPCARTADAEYSNGVWICRPKGSRP